VPLWVALKTAGEVETRARRVASRVWWGVLVLMKPAHGGQFSRSAALAGEFRRAPWGWVFPFVAIAALLTVAVMNYRLRERAAFLASSLFLAAMLVERGLRLVSRACSPRMAIPRAR